MLAMLCVAATGACRDVTGDGSDAPAVDTVSAPGFEAAGIGTSRAVLIGRALPLRVEGWYGGSAGANYDSVPGVFWKSSDPGVLKVGAGSAMALRAGSVMLTARKGTWTDSVRVDVLSTGYAVTYLGTLGGSYSRAIDLNDAGQVVGNATDAAGTIRAFRWTAGVITGLDRPPLQDGSALIDARGRVAGTPELPGPPGAVVTTVNDSGTIAGYWQVANSRDSAFVLRDGSVHRLPLSGRCGTGEAVPSSQIWDITSINNGVEVIGDGLAFSCYHAADVFHWSGSGLLDFPAGNSAAPWIRATALNDAGTFLVEYQTSPARAKATHLGSVIQSGVERRLSAIPQFQDVLPRDLNEKNQVVGMADFFNDTSLHGFLWLGSGPADLSLLTKDGSWTILEANAINESGQIAGVALNTRTGQRGAVLLTPAP